MNRAIKRQQEKLKKKSAKKFELNTKNTGLTTQQLTMMSQLMIKARQVYDAGDKVSAEKYCMQILALHPKNADAYSLLGGVALAAFKYEKALLLFTKALELAPDNHNIYNNLGLALKFLERHEEALKAFTNAQKLFPKNAEALNNMGSCHLTLGAFDDARKCFEAALKVDPTYTRPLLNLGGMKKYEKGDDLSKRLLSYENKMSEISASNEMSLQFALGKCHEDLENFEESMSHYIKANSLKWEELKYDGTVVFNKFKSLRQSLQPGPWTEEIGFGFQSDIPVFIVGMPRSGTTLVEQILDSHSEVHGAGELKFADKSLNGLKLPKDIIPKDPEGRKAVDNILKQRGEFYVKHIKKHAPNAKRIVDKMPLNFQMVGLLHLILPNAKIIHCTRNPVDTCLSNFKILFAEKNEFSFDFEELGKFYLAYKELTEYWDTLFPGKILTVQYEDVVSDIETQARRIVDHCDLQWEKGCLEFYKSKRAVHTASVTQVRQPIYNSSVGKWQRYGDTIAPLLKVLAPILD